MFNWLNHQNYDVLDMYLNMEKYGECFFDYWFFLLLSIIFVLWRFIFQNWAFHKHGYNICICLRFSEDKLLMIFSRRMIWMIKLVIFHAALLGCENDRSLWNTQSSLPASNNHTMKVKVTEITLLSYSDVWCKY